MFSDEEDEDYVDMFSNGEDEDYVDMFSNGEDEDYVDMFSNGEDEDYVDMFSNGEDEDYVDMFSDKEQENIVTEEREYEIIDSWDGEIALYDKPERGKGVNLELAFFLISASLLVTALYIVKYQSMNKAGFFLCLGIALLLKESNSFLSFRRKVYQYNYNFSRSLAFHITTLLYNYQYNIASTDIDNYYIQKMSVLKSSLVIYIAALIILIFLCCLFDDLLYCCIIVSLAVSYLVYSVLSLKFLCILNKELLKFRH